MMAFLKVSDTATQKWYCKKCTNKMQYNKK